jgi:putative alpha-1,2-mannosidase
MSIHFVGTGGHGHTFPGATMPFGMMQLSPDTRLDGWDGCSGYHYTDNHTYGFSHTHLSGTGILDYGDFLLMPTNEVILTMVLMEKKDTDHLFRMKTKLRLQDTTAYI